LLLAIEEWLALQLLEALYLVMVMRLFLEVVQSLIYYQQADVAAFFESEKLTMFIWLKQKWGAFKQIMYTLQNLFTKI
jgi:hypothetical protein